MSETPKFCGNCGSPLPPGAGFCGRCGHPVSGPDTVGEPPSSALPPPASTSPSTAGSTVLLYALIGIVAVVILAAAGWWFLFNDRSSVTTSQNPTPSAVAVAAETRVATATLPPAPAVTAVPTGVASGEQPIPSPTGLPATPTAVPPTATTAAVSPTPVPKSPTPPGPPAVASPRPGSPTPPIGPNPGTPVFSESFDDNSKGWSLVSGERSKRFFEDGTFHLAVLQEGLISHTYIPTTPQELTDFVVEVEATSAGKTQAWDYGILFRCMADNRYYRFGVTSNGRIGLAKLDGDSWTALVSWTASPAVKTGTSTNRIRVAAQGDSFTFYVNGSEVLKHADASLPTGQLAVYVASGQEAGVEASFDNIKVWASQ